METNTEESDSEARQARADRIRQLRDARNASLAGAAEDDEAPGELLPEDPGDGDPNYVDLIDQRMRELDQSDPGSAGNQGRDSLP
jgi:hypothetical protein